MSEQKPLGPICINCDNSVTLEMWQQVRNGPFIEGSHRLIIKVLKTY